MFPEDKWRGGDGSASTEDFKEILGVLKACKHKELWMSIWVVG